MATRETSPLRFHHECAVHRPTLPIRIAGRFPDCCIHRYCFVPVWMRTKDFFLERPRRYQQLAYLSRLIPLVGDGGYRVFLLVFERQADKLAKLVGFLPPGAETSPLTKCGGMSIQGSRAFV